MNISADKLYGNRVRVRACGLCIRDESILLANHRGLSDTGVFWAPPGGGIEAFEPATEALIREFREETGLDIDVGPLQFACEFIRNPLHAVELFFVVQITGGELINGKDPEMGASQLIQSVRFVGFEELNRIGAESKHGALRLVQSSADLQRLRGYYRI